MPPARTISSIVSPGCPLRSASWAAHASGAAVDPDQVPASIVIISAANSAWIRPRRLAAARTRSTGCQPPSQAARTPSTSEAVMATPASPPNSLNRRRMPSSRSLSPCSAASAASNTRISATSRSPRNTVRPSALDPRVRSRCRCFSALRCRLFLPIPESWQPRPSNTRIAVQPPRPPRHAAKLQSSGSRTHPVGDKPTPQRHLLATSARRTPQPPAKWRQSTSRTTPSRQPTQRDPHRPADRSGTGGVGHAPTHKPRLPRPHVLATPAPEARKPPRATTPPASNRRMKREYGTRGRRPRRPPTGEKPTPQRHLLVSPPNRLGLDTT